MVKRARIIYNPTSGHETIQRDLLEILSVYEDAGYETSAFATKKEPLSALKEARRAAKDKVDLIVAAGGDGTVNEVINGIAGLSYRPRVAIIPAGTTNDFARALKIPRDNLVDAAKVIENKSFSKLDVGQIKLTGKPKQYFINIAALGTMSEITYEVPSLLKTLYGYVAYMVKGAELLTRLQLSDVKITYDQQVFDGKVNLIFLALTNSVGGIEQIVPNAKLNDGKFTLLIVKEANFSQILSIVADLFNGGKHIFHPEIIYAKAKEVTIVPKKQQQLKINLDGEYGGDAPVKLTNLKQHISFVVGNDADEKLDKTQKEQKKISNKIKQEAKNLR